MIISSLCKRLILFYFTKMKLCILVVGHDSLTLT